DEWQVTVRTSVRGRRDPGRYETRGGISPVEPGRDPRGGGGEGGRRRGGQVVSEALRRGSGRGVGPARPARGRWAARPGPGLAVVLAVPSLGPGPPWGRRPNLLVPPSLAVIGVARTGTREVAALLADLLDWAYVDVGSLADEQFGLAPEAPSAMTELAQATVA